MSFDSAPPKQTPVNSVPTFSAKDLTKGGELANIILGDQTYTLRITRTGKLILTK